VQLPCAPGDSANAYGRPYADAWLARRVPRLDFGFSMLRWTEIVLEQLKSVLRIRIAVGTLERSLLTRP